MNVLDVRKIYIIPIGSLNANVTVIKYTPHKGLINSNVLDFFKAHFVAMDGRPTIFFDHLLIGNGKFRRGTEAQKTKRRKPTSRITESCSSAVV